MITAKVIADSIHAGTQKRLTTLELEYPRFIHAELMTHRVFSRNAASSRAIPIERTIELIKENTAMPIHWGANQPGMSADNQVDDVTKATARQVWYEARDAAIAKAQKLQALGLHKQIVNRILEPFSHIKVIVSSTEYDNFYELRRHKDAQPEIHELADRAYDAMEASTPEVLQFNDWHVPYVPTKQNKNWKHPLDGSGVMARSYYDPDTGDEIDYVQALKISASCCAQVSYRKLDASLEKANAIFDRLYKSKPLHASPFEHQAQVNHSRNSGNFRGGWIQFREMLPFIKLD